MTTDGIERLPRPVVAADEQQGLFIDGLLADAAQWHEDRIDACTACASRPGEDCPDHQADAAQIRAYARLSIGPLRLIAGDTAVLMAAASKAAVCRRSRPGADDQALAAGYEELGRQLTSSRLADTTARQLAQARALLAEHYQPPDHDTR